jgi:hypothetical protein
MSLRFTIRRGLLILRQPHDPTGLSGCRNGSGRNSTAFTTPKIAVFAPILSVRVITATTVKPGALRNMRNA